MFINVRAIERQSHPARYRAGRKFLNGEVVRMEVVQLPRDEAGKVIMPTTTQPSGHAWEVEHLPLDDEGKPSMSQIGREGFKALQADIAGLSIMGDGETQQQANSAALAAARMQIERLHRKLSDAEIYCAETEAENDKLTKRVLELEAQLAAKTAPPADPPKSETTTEEKPPADKPAEKPAKK